jgi:single-stranded DNA-binding protein
VWRRTRNGCSVTHFYLTTRHHRPTGDIETSSFQITAYGDLADRCVGLRVGQVVLVEGRLHEDRWMGPDDRRRSKVVIVATHMRLVRESPEADRGEGTMMSQQRSEDHRDVVACAVA